MILQLVVIKNNNSCVYCNITGFKFNIVTGIISAKMEFLEFVTYLILKLNIRLLIQLMALKFVIVQPTVENALNSENVFVVV
jgi:hypothetical protein